MNQINEARGRNTNVDDANEGQTGDAREQAGLEIVAVHENRLAVARTASNQGDPGRLLGCKALVVQYLPVSAAEDDGAA